jgi:hypothetical protein
MRIYWLLNQVEQTVTTRLLKFRKELKNRLNSGNVCYHAVQNFNFALKNLKIEIYIYLLL